MDNFGETAAGGGLAGIATGVANANQRDSGVEALRAIEQTPGRRGHGYSGSNGGMAYNASSGARNTYNASSGAPNPYSASSRKPVMPSNGLRQTDSWSSNAPMSAAAALPARGTPGSERDSLRLGQYPSGHYSDGPYDDSPYQRRSVGWDSINPNEIADDGDDEFVMDPRRKSARSSTHAILPAAGAATTAAGAGVLGGIVGRSLSGGFAGRNATGGNYGPVPGNTTQRGGEAEKSWQEHEHAKRRRRLFIILGTTLLVIALIVGAIIGGVLGSRNANSDGGPTKSSQSAAGDTATNGDLSSDSSEIKALMNNPNLHKVFPGMDYTPFNSQYPACLTNPPSQNNVTRDIAVLSQLTNQVRLYGTDCNQTDMVLHAIDRLKLPDMKVWLGVWIENNATTNERQLAQMWNVLDQHGAKPFMGAIIGNEVLYRKDGSSQMLQKYLKSVKQNFTSLGYDLPVSTSDLGDNWTADLAQSVDIVMSNIHPFFGGVEATAAAAWVWEFWQGHDVPLTQGTKIKQIISEVGWPSAGGNDCGAVDCTSKTQGSIAGITEMNTFMDDFVCQSMANGTDYFWYVSYSLFFFLLGLA